MKRAMEVITRANWEAIKKAKPSMCEALKELMAEEFQKIFFNNIYVINKIYAKKGLFQSMNTAAFIQFLLERFKIEYSKRDRSGV